jgi:hypothetical protein
MRSSYSRPFRASRNSLYRQFLRVWQLSPSCAAKSSALKPLLFHCSMRFAQVSRSEVSMARTNTRRRRGRHHGVG